MSPEDMQRYEVRGIWRIDRTAVIDLRCPRCQRSLWPDDTDEATLAELVQRAEEHGEVCR